MLETQWQVHADCGFFLTIFIICRPLSGWLGSANPKYFAKLGGQAPTLPSCYNEHVAFSLIV